MPELVWKRFIDLEVSYEELENARRVWLRLLEKSSHVRVHVAYAEFEAATASSMPNAREAMERGVKHFKAEQRSDERAMLLEQWLKLEREHGDEASVEVVEKRQPKRVKKRRKLPTEEGQPEAYEEYMDYVFPDDKPEQQNLKILEMAHAWKKRKLDGNAA